MTEHTEPWRGTVPVPPREWTPTGKEGPMRRRVREDTATEADFEALKTALADFRFPGGGNGVGFGGPHADELARSLLSTIFKEGGEGS